MCKVFVENPEKEAGFILYNHLYSRKSNSFTTQDIVNELKASNLQISKESIQKEINTMVDGGIVSQRVGHYVYFRQ